MAETLPPLTVDRLKEALENPHFSTYVYIGKEAHKGWKLALAAQMVLPALRVYRVAESLNKAVRTEFHVPQAHRGIVFGWGKKVRQTLTKSKATDFLTLTEALTEARR